MRITVKVECQESGEVVKAVDCGSDQAKADKIEDAIITKTYLERFFVYQSYEM